MAVPPSVLEALGRQSLCPWLQLGILLLELLREGRSCWEETEGQTPALSLGLTPSCLCQAPGQLWWGWGAPGGAEAVVGNKEDADECGKGFSLAAG